MKAAPLQPERLQWYYDNNPCSVSSFQNAVYIDECLGLFSETLAGVRSLGVPVYKGDLLSMFEFDWSSVFPRFNCRKETFLTRALYQELLPKIDIELDRRAHLPPKRKYSVELRISNTSRAKPLVVTSEDY
jgi:hypothetical protein